MDPVYGLVSRRAPGVRFGSDVALVWLRVHGPGVARGRLTGEWGPEVAAGLRRGRWARTGGCRVCPPQDSPCASKIGSLPRRVLYVLQMKTAFYLQLGNDCDDDWHW